jgi:diguanylate cyclase (GGDEF)-like protein
MFMERAQARHAEDPAGIAFGLLYLDLDGFKSLNDTHGHDAGDAALAHVGRVLQGELRPNDLAARLGGDEFVVLLLAQKASLKPACEQVAHRIHAGIAAHGRGLGCSIGLVWLRPGESIVDAMKRADQAMLAAKRSGKGRIAQA